MMTEKPNSPPVDNGSSLPGQNGSPLPGQSGLPLPGLDRLRIDRNRPPSPRRRWGLWIGAALVLVLVIVLVARTLRPRVAGVRLYSIPDATARGRVVLSADGHIIAHHTIFVNSKITGKISWIGVHKGQQVRKGQVLVRLEATEFRAQVEQARGQVDAASANLRIVRHGSRPQEIREARANLRQARATLAEDAIVLHRDQKLFASGIVARQQLDSDQALYNADLARAHSLGQAYRLAVIGSRPSAILQAQGQLLQARGQLAYAQTLLRATRIRAPVSGTILDRTAEVGELITSQFASTASGGPIGSVVELANLNDLQAQCDIAEGDFARLRQNEPAEITTDAYPDRRYAGLLTEIAPIANRAKGTVQVKVQILHPDAYLKPEMNATVRFLALSHPHAAPRPGSDLPVAAVHQGAGGPYVWLDVDGRAQRHSMRVLRAGNRSDRVTGVLPGEQVIVQGAAGVQSGEKLKELP